MTEQLFKDDSYLKECNAAVVSAENDAVVLDRTIFYAMGGGQPGDTGTLNWDNHSATVIDTRFGDDGEIRHLVAAGTTLPAVGAAVTAVIDWDRRYLHMRMHTGLHLLGSVLKYGVTGGNISANKSRLDFDMEDSVDKEQVNAALKELVDADHAVTCRWISTEELDENPELVRTMSVQPPKGAGQIRLLDIDSVDLQPCGGTHLKSTGEVGDIRVGKVEKKGKRNRRVSILLDQN